MQRLREAFKIVVIGIATSTPQSDQLSRDLAEPSFPESVNWA